MMFSQGAYLAVWILAVVSVCVGSTWMLSRRTRPQPLPTARTGHSETRALLRWSRQVAPIALVLGGLGICFAMLRVNLDAGDANRRRLSRMYTYGR